MIASDGRDSVYPNCEAVEARCYVPHTLALEKLQTASVNYSRLKFDCAQHILELTEAYDDHRQRTQIFYENFIREIKVMAKSQIDSQQVAHSRIVGSVHHDLKISALEVERLRDQLTFLRLEHQLESRSLRYQLSSANDREILLNRQALDESVKIACTSVIAELIAKVEVMSTTLYCEETTKQLCLQHSRSMDSHMKDCNLLQSQLASAIEKEVIKAHEDAIRDESSAVISDLISQIELAFISKEHEGRLGVIVEHLVDILHSTNSNLYRDCGASVVADIQNRALLLIKCVGEEQVRLLRECDNVRLIVDKYAETESRIEGLEAKMSSDKLQLAAEASQRLEESRSSSVKNAAVIDDLVEQHRKEVLHLVNDHGVHIAHLTDVIAAQSEAAITAAVESTLLGVITCIELLRTAAVGLVPCETEIPDGGQEAAERAKDVQSKERNSAIKEQRDIACTSGAEPLGVHRLERSHGNDRMTVEACLGDINSIDQSEEELISDQFKSPKCEATSPAAHPAKIVSPMELLHLSTSDIGRSAVDVDCCESSSDATRMEEHKYKYVATIEALEDAVYELQQGRQEAARVADASQEERKLLHDRLDALIKEKRTDVVCTYETRIADFRAKETVLQDHISKLTSEGVKKAQYVLDTLIVHDAFNSIQFKLHHITAIPFKSI